jgi:hypothetical protein
MIETLRGIAGNISRGSGEARERQATVYKTIFEVDGKPVELTLGDMPVINEGDEIIVAGKNKKGLLKSYSYKNITKGVSGNNVSRLNLGGLIFCLPIVIIPIIGQILGIFLFYGIYLQVMGIKATKKIETELEEKT